MNYPENKKPVRPVNTEKEEVMKKAEEAVREFRMSNKASGYENGGDNIQSDILGSYTGMFYDGDTPDQDADDL